MNFKKKRIWKDKLPSDFNLVDKKNCDKRQSKKSSLFNEKIYHVAHNLELQGPHKIRLKDARSRHFALQIAFLKISVRLSGSKLCPFKIEIFLEKAGDLLIFAPTLLTIDAVRMLLDWTRNVG